MNSSRNILIVSTPAIKTPPEQYGGMERAVSWLSKGLRRMGHNVAVLCKTGSEVPGAIFGESEQEFSDIASQMIQAGSIDVIVDFSHDKVVTRSHPEFPQLNVYQVMSVSWSNCNVFISLAQKRSIGAPGRVIYYGLDMDEYKLSSIVRPDSPDTDYYLYMGSVIPEKQVHLAVEAVESVGGKIKIAGPAWDSSYYPVIEEMKAKDCVEWVGDIGGQEKIDLIANAKALVHLVGGKGWVEAGAIIVLEALALGTPVICSSNGVLPEYITDGFNGFLCDTVKEAEIAMGFIGNINRINCRRSVLPFNSYTMAMTYNGAIQDVIGGARW